MRVRISTGKGKNKHICQCAVTSSRNPAPPYRVVALRGEASDPRILAERVCDDKRQKKKEKKKGENCHGMIPLTGGQDAQ